MSYMGKYVFHDIVGWNHTGKIKIFKLLPFRSRNDEQFDILYSPD